MFVLMVYHEGMLASADTVEDVNDALERHKVDTMVLDPVMVSTRGHPLLLGGGIRNLRERLLPRTTLLTPNIPEAMLLLRDADIQCKSPRCLDDLEVLAKTVHQLRPRAVLLKGGHMPLTESYTKAMTEDEKHLVVDILYDGMTITTLESKHIRSRNMHGTACSLASAITANMARLKSRLRAQASEFTHQSNTVDFAAAVQPAVQYVWTAIQTSYSDPGSGTGSGPINHFHNTLIQPFSRGHFIDYVLSHPRVSGVWKQHTTHPFPQALARGTLPEALFKKFLIQDYLYLTHAARAHVLAAYKSRTISDATAEAENIMLTRREMALHLDYCEEFGISQGDIERPDCKESVACVAYSQFLIDVGITGDWLVNQIVHAPCLLGYGVVARALLNDPLSVRMEQGNKYRRWIGNYVAEDSVEGERKGRALIELRIVDQSPAGIEELVEIFAEAAEMEIRFWDNAY
ncbi:hypothetical protein ACHAPJ_013225 [Fusarium lateritium]